MSERDADFLTAASAVVSLLGRPEVARQWDQPSALPEMPVSALTGHLARQVFSVERLLEAGPAAEPPLSLSEHYDRAAWIDTGRDSEANAGIREDGAAEAADGPAALTALVLATIERLAVTLPGVPAGQPVLLPWGPWALTIEDLLLTRLMEIAVHGDDLAVSVGLAAPDLPPAVIRAVVELLARLALRRHGPVPVIRALSRAERAPASIAAF